MPLLQTLKLNYKTWGSPKDSIMTISVIIHHYPFADVSFWGCPMFFLLFSWDILKTRHHQNFVDFSFWGCPMFFLLFSWDILETRHRQNFAHFSFRCGARHYPIDSFNCPRRHQCTIFRWPPQKEEGERTMDHMWFHLDQEWPDSVWQEKMTQKFVQNSLTGKMLTKLIHIK